MKSVKLYFAPIVAFAVLAVAGCGSMGGVKGESDEVLRTRAVERWDLLIAHKADKAWDYLSPGFRETKPREAYAAEMNNRGLHWTKATFQSQACDADTCKVRLMVNYNVDLGGPVGRVGSLSPIEETWIKVKGHWYFLPDPLEPAKLGGNS